MNQLPYFGSSVISLAIPAEDRLAYARKALDKAARQEAQRRRLHTVRGHWHVVDAKPVTHLCRHFPTMVEDGLAVCERCERLVRWIESHERGDPTVGIVDHRYEVTAEG